MSLPPLSALEALEALARQGSVSAAARHMGLSQSAVSHKLRALEARLGFALTRPAGRGVEMTGQARRYVEAIRPALETLRAAQAQVDTAAGRLVLACASGFAATWLAPRIGAFRQLHPEVALTVRSTPAAGDAAQADLAIVFADAPPAGAMPLLDVTFFPVCSPSFFHASGVPKASALSPASLLHLNTRADWAAWLDRVGADPGLAQGGVIFSDVLAMLAAAEAGQGLCLGDALTCDAALGAGRLVRPFRQHVAVPGSYWIIPGPGGITGAARAFADWVQADLG